VIATKVGARPLAPGTSFTDNAEGLSARVIRESAERSLDRLGLSRLDVLYPHIEDPAVPLVETVEGFAALVAEGTVGLLGVSSRRRWHSWPASSRSASCG
jgi:aryl-alcohol dehydrogenase-like predicted oxidoreductase